LSNLGFVLSLLYVAWSSEQTATMVELVIIGSAILGFLVYKLRWPGRPSALVFVGDGGSLLLGFLPAWYLVGLS
jgi:UDP-GlcNAc:undecaprenyl-phosphate GlcNAc-1-phosphate transferase